MKLILGENGKFRAEVPAFDGDGDPTTNLGDATVNWELTDESGTITQDPNNPFAADGQLGTKAGSFQVNFTVTFADGSKAVRTGQIEETPGTVKTLGDMGLAAIQ